MTLVDYIYNNPIINTNRLILRPLSESDIPGLLTWVSDKSRYMNATSDNTQCLAFVCEHNSLKKYHWGIQFENKVVGELWMHLNEQYSTA